MDGLQEHFLNTVLPYRLYSLGCLEMALSLVREYPNGASLQCKFNDKLKVQGSSSIITNANVELGIIHCRVLMEFLGVKVDKNMNLISAGKPRDSDVTIESFELPKLTLEQVVEPCTSDKELARKYIAKTLFAANKLIAHATNLVKLEEDSIDGYIVTARAIPVLFKNYFYNPLKLEIPNYKVDKYEQPDEL